MDFNFLIYQIRTWPFEVVQQVNWDNTRNVSSIWKVPNTRQSWWRWWWWWWCRDLNFHVPVESRVLFSSSDSTSMLKKGHSLSERKLLSPETVLQRVTLQKHCFGKPNKSAIILIYRQRQEGAGWSRIQETDNVMTPFIKKPSVHTSCPPAGKWSASPFWG